jgi:hypothetical protein
MDEVLQERAVHTLTLAIGLRLRVSSPIALAEALEDLALEEAASITSLSRASLGARPPAELRRRADLVRAYLGVVASLAARLAAPECNDAAWWAAVNRTARGAWGGGGGDAGGAVTPRNFFDHYAPPEGWRAAATAALARDAADERAVAPEFPSAARPASIDEYVRIYAGTGALGAATARDAITNLLLVKGIDGTSLLPSLGEMRAAAAAAEGAGAGAGAPKKMKRAKGL